MVLGSLVNHDQLIFRHGDVDANGFFRKEREINISQHPEPAICEKILTVHQGFYIGDFGRGTNTFPFIITFNGILKVFQGFIKRVSTCKAVRGYLGLLRQILSCFFYGL